MYPLQISLLFHIIGIGMIFTSVIGGWIVNSRYGKAADWGTKSMLLSVLRPIGMLSPFAVLLMLITGITNMHFAGLGLFSAAWLTLKLVFFALMVVSGVLFAVRGARRAKLVSQMSGGTAPAQGDAILRGLDRQQKIFFVVQTVLLLIIIALSLFRPSA